MSKVITIGLDHGFGITKTANTHIITSVAEYSTRPAIASDNLLTYVQGDTVSYYELGGRRNILRRDKTTTNEYWILTLGAIALELMARNLDGEQTVRIAAGLPLYRFSEEADKFRTYLNRGGVQNYEMKGKSFAITISGVHIYPQGYSALLADVMTLKREASVHIIDVGSWTTDTLTLEKGIPVAHSERSIENGVIRCFDRIRQKILEEHEMELSEQQIEDVLWWRNHSIPQLVERRIREEAKVWAKDMIDYLYQIGFNLSSCPVYFVGGGARLLSKYLPRERKEKFLAVFYKTNIHENARGFEIACEMQRQKESGA